MLKSYASYFSAYLLDSIADSENIQRIVLFGSAAKGEAGGESDVDIFIEVKKKTGSFQRGIEEIEKQFYQSREAIIFKSKGIANKLSIKVGKLKEWKEIYNSIASTGIVLYGPYEAKELPSGAGHNVIIFWDKVEKNRGAFLNKIYGFNIKNKHYSGLLEKFDGKKLGKSCIMIPVQHKEEAFRLIKEHKARAKLIEVYR